MGETAGGQRASRFGLYFADDGFFFFLLTFVPFKAALA